MCGNGAGEFGNLFVAQKTRTCYLQVRKIHYAKLPKFCSVIFLFSAPQKQIKDHAQSFGNFVFGDTAMSNELIPFGKHKGQPVETLIADDAYTAWLIEQPWFKEKYKNIYLTVINYGAEPTDTPEHNAMQIKFLDDEYCLKFLCLTGLFNEDHFNELVSSERLEKQLEVDGWDVLLRHYFPIEIKPTMGDDYPSVYRQISRRMKGAHYPNYRRQYDRSFLLIGGYTGIGATYEQVIAFFAQGGIKVLLAADIEAVALPPKPSA